MPAIKPVSDLRSYNEVLSDVHEGSPVFLTKNGRGRYAILDMKDFDRLNAAGTLMSQLEAGKASGEQSALPYPQFTQSKASIATFVREIILRFTVRQTQSTSTVSSMQKATI